MEVPTTWTPNGINVGLVILGSKCVGKRYVHDEIQLGAREEVASKIGDLCVKAIEIAGEVHNLKIPITGEYKIGQNWKDCH